VLFFISAQLESAADGVKSERVPAAQPMGVGTVRLQECSVVSRSFLAPALHPFSLPHCWPATLNHTRLLVHILHVQQPFRTQTKHSKSIPPSWLSFFSHPSCWDRSIYHPHYPQLWKQITSARFDSGASDSRPSVTHVCLGSTLESARVVSASDPIVLVPQLKGTIRRCASFRLDPTATIPSTSFARYTR